jgi:hypothetical protein
MRVDVVSEFSMKKININWRLSKIFVKKRQRDLNLNNDESKEYERIDSKK